MLSLVKTPVVKLEKYEKLISRKDFSEIKKLSKDLKGLKVFHVNSTPYGGGVAEILRSLIPLMKGVGVKAEWFTIPPDNDFFEITKKMHNALQGQRCGFSVNEKEKYLKHLKKTANLMNGMNPDVWVIHDPQPAGVIKFFKFSQPAICRVHIDLTEPNQKVWKFLLDFFKEYDKIIFSSKSFVKKELSDKAIIIFPAIDPLVSKNLSIESARASKIVRRFGISNKKPLISQVSRFDPWKDPIGVIRAYRIAKKSIPNLQLALVGFITAKDDPEAIRFFKKTKKEAGNDPDIFLFSDKSILKELNMNDFVGAIQTVSDVILQKSIKEGFGLTVSEAMWKEKAVIGGPAEGIKNQIKNGKNGFICSGDKETAFRIVQLVKDKKLNRKLGKEGKAVVRNNFLMPRLLKDYLKLFECLNDKKSKH